MKENKKKLLRLREIDVKLSTPQKWCKGAGARDNAGFACDPHSGRGYSFCLVGALQFVARSKEADFSNLMSGLDNTKVMSYNDISSFAEIKSFLRGWICYYEDELRAFSSVG